MKRKNFKTFFLNVRAGTAIEYALLAGLVAISLIAGARSVEGKSYYKFQQVTHNL